MTAIDNLSARAVIDDGTARDGTPVTLAVRSVASLEPGDIVALNISLGATYNRDRDDVIYYETLTRIDKNGAHFRHGSYLSPEGECVIIVGGIPEAEGRLVEADPDDHQHLPVDELRCADAACTNLVAWHLAEIEDTYDSGHERVQWFNAYRTPTGRLFCEEVHGG